MKLFEYLDDDTPGITLFAISVVFLLTGIFALCLCCWHKADTSESHMDDKQIANSQ